LSMFGISGKVFWLQAIEYKNVSNIKNENLKNLVSILNFRLIFEFCFLGIHQFEKNR